MKDIYVNKDGIICACKVEVPDRPMKGHYWNAGSRESEDKLTENYQQSLQACKESAVPFENQEEAHQNIEQRFCIYELRPDTFYQIEADWEIFTECECLNFDPKIPCALNDKHCKGTKFARLKVPAPTVATDNSGEPDFEQMAKDFSSNQSHLTYIKCGPRCINNVDHDFVDHTLAIRSWYKQGLECIWNTHVLPLQKLIRSKNKSIKEAYECLKHPSVPLSAAIKILRKAKESEPSPVEEEQEDCVFTVIEIARMESDMLPAQRYEYIKLNFTITRKNQQT